MRFERHRLFAVFAYDAPAGTQSFSGGQSWATAYTTKHRGQLTGAAMRIFATRSVTAGYSGSITVNLYKGANANDTTSTLLATATVDQSVFPKAGAAPPPFTVIMFASPGADLPAGTPVWIEFVSKTVNMAFTFSSTSTPPSSAPELTTWYSRSGAPGAFFADTTVFASFESLMSGCF